MDQCGCGGTRLGVSDGGVFCRCEHHAGGTHTAGRSLSRYAVAETVASLVGRSGWFLASNDFRGKDLFYPHHHGWFVAIDDLRRK